VSFADVVNIPIAVAADIVIARQHGRALAVSSTFSSTDATVVATIIAELTRNVVLYARKGDITLARIKDHDHHGLAITCRDEGPGILDVRRILAGGYSTSGGLGLGLYGVRRMVNEFHIDTTPGIGTVVTVKKWHT
jgi:serine/threonine-protein kinase RsbT